LSRVIYSSLDVTADAHDAIVETTMGDLLASEVRRAGGDENGRLASRESGGRYRRSLGIQMKITEGRVRLAAGDVANFLACRRLTQLDLLRARGELRPPREFNVGFQDLVRRGEVHERDVLGRFRADGLGVVDVSGAEDGAGATAEAIRGGAGVVTRGR
jgi:hypothetical protein